MQKILRIALNNIGARLALVSLVMMVFAAGTAAALHTQLPVEPEYISSNHAIDQEVIIDFGQSLASIGLPRITPEADGEWVYQQGPIGITGASFMPSRPLLVSQTYVISFEGAQRVATGAVAIPDIVFRTEDAPSLASFSPTDTIAADHIFAAELTSKNRGLRQLELETEPSLDLTMSTGDDRVYTWRADDLLPQGKSIKLILRDTQNDIVLAERQIKVADQPAVKSYAKSSDVMPGDLLVIEFKQPIDRSRLPDDAIKFTAAGTGEWQGDTVYHFTPSGLQPGRSYDYTIAADLRTKQGGILAKAVSRSFSTRGQVQLANASPQGSGLAQGGQDIKISFNQPVDKQSVADRVSVSTGTIKSRQWQGNTYVIKLANIGYQKTVRVSVAPGVKPTGFGLTNSNSLGFSFTTEVRSRRLNVPYYRQVYAQSCEAASLRMALAYRGTNSTDWNILQKFGYSPTAKDKKNNVWGDPQKGFVGDVNGNQGAGTGWGVYAEPVASATRSFGRQATVRYGVSAQFLAQQIYDGNPVILWGIWGNSASIQKWKTPEGKTVSGPFPMHVRLVVGVVGEPGSPQGFYVHDPITGTAYWSAGQLIGNTQKAGAANQAVVVH